MSRISKNAEEVRVFVYRLGSLSKTVTFRTLASAHRFIQNEVAIGSVCVMQRLENGRAWATVRFWPNESI